VSPGGVELFGAGWFGKAGPPPIGSEGWTVGTETGGTVVCGWEPPEELDGGCVAARFMPTCSGLKFSVEPARGSGPCSDYKLIRSSCLCFILKQLRRVVSATWGTEMVRG
jgi:hypothetical protein